MFDYDKMMADEESYLFTNIHTKESEGDEDE